MYKVDARGLSCPEPLMLTNEALKKEGVPLEVVVDDACAKTNIEKFAKSQGKKVTIKENGSDTILTIE